MKNDLFYNLKNVYRDKGLEIFLNVCSELILIKDKHDLEKKKKTNGIVCEAVLYIMTYHYLKSRNIKGSIFHSIVLKDLDKVNDNFRTELDITILTPGLCLTGECKSYYGDIFVVGKGVLKRGDLKTDIYNQSILHVTNLKKYLQRQSKLTNPPFGIFGFLYSNGKVYDKRTVNDKKVLPILTLNNLFSYYDDVFGRYRKQVYNYEKLQQDFRNFEQSKELHSEHKDFLGY